MAAISRWTKYPIDAIGLPHDGGTGCRGDRAFTIGTSNPGDTITIAGSTNRLYITIDGDSAPYVTLVSGSALDPRFVAKDITEKLHNIPSQTGTKYKNAICRWENAFDPHTYISYGYRFKIYNGDSGSGSAITVQTGGTDDASGVLGFSSQTPVGGLDNGLAGHTYGFQGTLNASGIYNGMLDEVYKIVISNDNEGLSRGIGSVVKNGNNNYDGTVTTGGVFNTTLDTEYTINVSIDGSGATMGAGSGNVPTITWTSSDGSDPSSGPVELLYPDHWINIGQYGLMVKFSDAVFNTSSPGWTIQCRRPDYAAGTSLNSPVGTAQYVWASDRGDMSSSPTTTISGVPTALGSRGLTVEFIGDSELQAMDEFYVYCSAPLPEDHGGNGISSLNYGNVTVSTESDVKCVTFEVKSGAIEVSTVKFGLQDHGTFVHHEAGNGDTNFRFGTVGPASYALGTGAQKLEWHQNVLAADIDNDTPPPYLYATKEDLLEVQTADESQVVNNYGLMSDAIFVNIHLGSSETGANSGINMRLYFDYS